MLTGKQRRAQRLMQKIEPTVYIGKADLTENIVRLIDENLFRMNFVKCRFRKAHCLDPTEVCSELQRLFILNSSLQLSAACAIQKARNLRIKSSCRRPRKQFYIFLYIILKLIETYIRTEINHKALSAHLRDAKCFTVIVQSRHNSRIASSEISINSSKLMPISIAAMWSATVITAA